ncbi:MAG: type II toxin-antitoxin system VapC family toxin [Armatimonadota bacterium]
MRSYCWDTSVVLALLMGGEDNRTPEEVLGLRAAVDDINNGRAALVTSTLIFAEVLPAALGPQRYETFERFFERENVEVHEVSAAIARHAGEVRRRAAEAGRKLAAEDAIFIATALVAECEALHTFDPHQLRLASMLGDELVICRPTGTQASMDLDRPAQQ